MQRRSVQPGIAVKDEKKDENVRRRKKEEGKVEGGGGKYCRREVHGNTTTDVYIGSVRRILFYSRGRRTLYL